MNQNQATLSLIAMELYRDLWHEATAEREANGLEAESFEHFIQHQQRVEAIFQRLKMGE